MLFCQQKQALLNQRTINGIELFLVLLLLLTLNFPVFPDYLATLL
jgi:hypothetical protein